MITLFREDATIDKSELDELIVSPDPNKKSNMSKIFFLTLEIKK